MKGNNNIKNAISTIDDCLSKLRCSMAILNQNKTFLGDAYYALETLEGSEYLLKDAIKYIKSFIESFDESNSTD